MNELDLHKVGVRGINSQLHSLPRNTNEKHWVIHNPKGQHSIAVGLDAPLQIDIRGHVGFYCGGMNSNAEITIHGHAGVGTAENMMSGVVWVKGNSSESAGATGHGGTLIIEGDASLRCGISLKGLDIVVGGNVGNFSCFMAQAGAMVVCGDAGHALGDSLYEAVIYVRGKIKSLGADARIEEMTDADHQKVSAMLDQGGFKFASKEFKRVASAKSLYNWNADADQEY